MVVVNIYIGGANLILNEEIRRVARCYRIPLWEIALRLGVSEATFTRWMRIPLDTSRRDRVEKILQELVSEREKDYEKLRK